jgi:hypothetical protein
MLDLRRLQLLREFSARGTIVATANALGYTPSAISRRCAHSNKCVAVESRYADLLARVLLDCLKFVDDHSELGGTGVHPYDRLAFVIEKENIDMVVSVDKF